MSGQGNSPPPVRRHSRLRVRVPVRYGPLNFKSRAFAENLSEGGAYIDTAAVYDVGAHLNLAVEFPDRTFMLRGEVVWIDEVPGIESRVAQAGMGLAFLRPSYDWLQFCRKRVAAGQGLAPKGRDRCPGH